MEQIAIIDESKFRFRNRETEKWGRLLVGGLQPSPSENSG